MDQQPPPGEAVLSDEERRIRSAIADALSTFGLRADEQQGMCLARQLSVLHDKGIARLAVASSTVPRSSDDSAEPESPNFVPQSAKDLAARNFERVNLRAETARSTDLNALRALASFHRMTLDGGVSLQVCLDAIAEIERLRRPTATVGDYDRKPALTREERGHIENVVDAQSPWFAECLDKLIAERIREDRASRRERATAEDTKRRIDADEALASVAAVVDAAVAFKAANERYSMRHRAWTDALVNLNAAVDALKEGT